MSIYEGDKAGGRYVMWPTSVDGSAGNNFVFSECSRWYATDTVVSSQGDKCFTDTGTGAICGNGILQGNEASFCV
jgi:hypothetical protein